VGGDEFFKNPNRFGWGGWVVGGGGGGGLVLGARIRARTPSSAEKSGVLIQGGICTTPKGRRAG